MAKYVYSFNLFYDDIDDVELNRNELRQILSSVPDRCYSSIESAAKASIKEAIKCFHDPIDDNTDKVYLQRTDNVWLRPIEGSAPRYAIEVHFLVVGIAGLDHPLFSIVYGMQVHD